MRVELEQLGERYKTARNRYVLTFTVSSSADTDAALHELYQFSPNSLFVGFDDVSSLAQCNTIDINATRAILGSELEFAVLDCRRRFATDAFGVVSGCIVPGGGLALVLSDHAGQKPFLQRAHRILNSTGLTHAWEVSSSRFQDSVFQPERDPETLLSESIYATNDQAKAVETVERCALGQRRKPAVLLSDRGRGKSAALGIAATNLAKAGLKSIKVCTRQDAAADAVRKHLALPDTCESSIEFVDPAWLAETPRPCDLILIDEAATIPIPTLLDIAERYPRIAFASTVHGYEGTGRGFELRFLPELGKISRGVRIVRLNQPIRWSAPDPLEMLGDELMLFGSGSQTTIQKINEVTVGDFSYDCIDARVLTENESNLRAVYSLLVMAHYRTKPLDLEKLLDEKDAFILCAKYAGELVGVTLVIREPEITADLEKKISEATRRPGDGLVSQSLITHLRAEITGIPTFRIDRIAVHPGFLRQGIGSAMIEHVHNKIGESALLGSSFSMQQTVIRFWKKCGFAVLRLGFRQHRSTGDHSCLVLSSKSSVCPDLLPAACAEFRQNLGFWLAGPYHSIHPRLISLALASHSNIGKPVSNIDSNERDFLLLLADSSQNPQNHPNLLWKSLIVDAVSEYPALDTDSRSLLVGRYFQHRDWNNLKNLGLLPASEEPAPYSRKIISKLAVSVAKSFQSESAKSLSA
ncbi:MAG: GNAT family N-acetyltransferase [Pseudomonadota bacterium]